MAEPPPAAELEIRLQSTTADAVLVDIQFCDSASAVDAILAVGVPAQFDLSVLLPQSLDPQDYGRALAAQLFADERLRNAWATARGYTRGANATLRLRL